MAIVRCSKGHFYDDAKYSSCPSCQGSSSGPRWQMEDEKTVSLDSFGGPEVRQIKLSAEEPVKRSVVGTWDNEKTVSLSGYDREQLLVGWVVCVKGAMRGKDFRIYPGFNRIGRNMDSDICIQDMQVARADHCSVVYDDKKSQFYLVPGKGTITYLNEEAVQKAVSLEDGDRIRLGETTLELAAFCKGDHVWQTM